VLGDEDGDVLAIGTSPLNDGGRVQVPPVLVQRSDGCQPIYERGLGRWGVEAVAKPLEVQLGLLAVVQAPEEAP
jgi:hypothetical protein